MRETVELIQMFEIPSRKGHRASRKGHDSLRVAFCQTSRGYVSHAFTVVARAAYGFKTASEFSDEFLSIKKVGS